ncbi:hypothetical protein MKW98_014951 [Papaver atlanticum]|uniref:EGF-like domain-containing protein n=1 Tax=Papaver atlanticum TaxID=357466 RepID=A0AAD4XHZ8_9MAGN|nr:hypothetical protein MKW98_014951 [Papaver atlanticum]
MASLHVLLKYFHCLVLLLCLQLASAEIRSNSTSGVIAKPYCPDRCGNISIPYPFGIGRGCFVNKFFELTCNNSVPMIGSLKVTNLAVDDGQMTVESIIASTCNSTTFFVNTYLGTFTVSATKNKLISIGCDTMAAINDYPPIGFNCSNCNFKKNVAIDGACDGMGCCETSIPPRLSSYNVSVGRFGENSIYDNPCSYAFIAENSSFQFSPSYLQDFKNKGTGVVPLVVDWTIGFVTCDIAATDKTSYACGPNTLCESCNSNTPGYLCKCKPGFEGNPYLSSSTVGHCKDINECVDKNLIHDERCGRPESICFNTEGGYDCPCKEGFKEYGTKCILDKRAGYHDKIAAGMKICGIHFIVFSNSLCKITN